MASGAETSAARAGAVVWTPPARVARAERGVPGTASPSVSAAEKQGRRIAAEADQTISIPKDKEGGLAVAAKAMLQQAHKLAATARAVAVESVSWRQARQLDVLQRASSRMTGKSGRTMHSKRGLWARQANKRHRLNRRKPQDGVGDAAGVEHTVRGAHEGAL